MVLKHAQSSEFSDSMGKGKGPSTVVLKVRRAVAVHWLLEGPAGHEGPVPIIGTDLALSLLCICK